MQWVWGCQKTTVPQLISHLHNFSFTALSNKEKEVADTKYVQMS